jgi:hypothetical protein
VFYGYDNRLRMRDRCGGPCRGGSCRENLGLGRLFARGLGIVALGLAAVVAFEPGLAPGLPYAASPGGKGGK